MPQKAPHKRAHKIMAFLFCAVVLQPGAARAQSVTIDNSLSPAQVLPGPIYSIDATLGSQQTGNLYQSFGAFSLNPAESDLFSGPGTGSITDIIARVTGGGASSINSVVAVDQGGGSTVANANLEFINPAGIVLGASSGLSVGGNVVFSTANAIVTADGAAFDAGITGSSLDAAAPTALRFTSAPASALTVNSASLTTTPGKDLDLSGASVAINSSLFIVPAGNIYLTGVSSAGVIPLAGSAVTPTITTHGDVSITGSQVILNDLASTQSGALIVHAGTLTVDGSEISIDNLSAATLSPASLLSADTQINIQNLTYMHSQTTTATGADITLQTPATGGITFDHGELLTLTSGAGTGGNIAINTGALVLSNNARLVSETTDVGNGGNITIAASSMTVESGAGVISEKFSSGPQGTLTINAPQITLSGGGEIQNATVTGAINSFGGTLDSIRGTASLNMTGGTTTLADLNLFTALSGTGTLNNTNAQLIIDQASNTVYAGNIIGGGAFDKAGTGKLTLDGVNTYTALTSVGAGILEIGDAGNPGASVAFSVQVNPAGTLTGYGSIGGNLINGGGGLVQPGKGGTLQVGAHYLQGGVGGTLKIEISPTTNSRLDVAGIATLLGNSVLSLVYDPGVYKGHIYTVLQAGTLAGTFTTVKNNAPGISQTVSYTVGPDTVTVAPLGVFAVTPPNATAYSALRTSMISNMQDAETALLDHLGGGSSNNMAPVSGVSAGNSPAFGDMLAALPDAALKAGGWFTGMGSWSRLRGADDASDSSVAADNGGFMAGLDRPFGPHTIAGIAGGWSQTNLSQSSGATGTIDTPRLMAYGSYDFGKAGIDGMAGYAYSRATGDRPVISVNETASSAHEGNELDAALQARVRLDRGPVSVTPMAGLRVAALHENGFTETGAPGFNMTMPSQWTESVRPFAGVRFDTAVRTAGGMIVRPELDAAYSHELLNTPASIVEIGGGAFSTSSPTPSRDAFRFGGSVKTEAAKAVSFYAAYHATLPTGNFLEQTASAGLNVRF